MLNLYKIISVFGTVKLSTHSMIKYLFDFTVLLQTSNFLIVVHRVTFMRRLLSHHLRPKQIKFEIFLCAKSIQTQQQGTIK